MQEEPNKYVKELTHEKSTNMASPQKFTQIL